MLLFTPKSVYFINNRSLQVCADKNYFGRIILCDKMRSLFGVCYRWSEIAFDICHSSPFSVDLKFIGDP